MEKQKVNHALLHTYCRWEFPTNFVKMIANHHQLSNINTESLNVLSYDCTYQLFTVLGYAKKIANQNKREHLKGSDIVAAFKLCDYNGNSQTKYQFESSYTLRNTDNDNSRSKGVLSFVDKEFDLDSFLSQPPLKLPRDVVIHEHWLSINGLVPDIPENIPQVVEDNVKVLELAEYNSNSFSYKNMSLPHSVSNSTNANLNSLGQPLTVFSDKVPLLIERQLVYKELTESCFGPNENKKKEALNVMSTDLVMKELTPHFACFVRETTKFNVQKPNLGILLNCVRMIKAIFENPFLKKEFMQNHLHYFVPSLLNCIVSRRMCVKSDSENHWALRCFASKTLANICTSFQTSLPSLSLRVCNVAKQVVDCCQTSPNSDQCLNINIKPSTSSQNEMNNDDDIIAMNEDIFKCEDIELSTNDQQESYDKHTESTVDINIDSVPFSSYYGAATLLFDMGLSVAKLTLTPLLPKLGSVIEMAIEGDNAASHSLAKYEANHLKELLIKQAKYIFGNNILRAPEDIDACCASYGPYLGRIIYRELTPIRNQNATVQQSNRYHLTPNAEKPYEENKHVL